MQPSFGRLVATLYRKNQMYINAKLKCFGITSGEVGFLMSLYRQEGQTQEELASFLSIDKAAATRSLCTLEQKHYIERRQDQHDKRCNRIFLTPESRKIETEVVTCIHQYSEHIASLLGEPTYQELCTTLERINKEQA